MPWYKGKSIFKTLENIKIESDSTKEKLRLPIQWVNRTSSDFRGFSGSIVSGKIKKGDVVNILPQGTRAKINELIVSGKKSQVASKNTAVTVKASKKAERKAETKQNIRDNFVFECIVTGNFVKIVSIRFFIK